MILTLATRSLRTLVSNNGDGSLSMLELPAYAIKQFELRGLNVPSSMLTGWSLEDLDRLRDNADKAGCPCLVLIEDQPLPFVANDKAQRAAAANRVQRLALAASRLACNALAVRCEAPDTDEALDEMATKLKEVMPAMERSELNLLIAPHDGLTASPQRLTDLLKRIGGFRVGSLPNFGHAAATGDLVASLRILAPYAGAVHATVEAFDRQGVHKSYDLAEGVAAIRSVGFVNTLAIDYVGSGDPVANIDKARKILTDAIEAKP